MAVGPYAWSLTASSNATADSNINWAEGQLAPTLNNSARAMMAAVKALLNTLSGNITHGGSANAYTATNDAPATWGAYAAGRAIVIKPIATNTSTTPTLNVDGLGTRTIKRADGAALAAGDLQAGGYYYLIDSGSDFRVIGGTALGLGSLTDPGADRIAFWDDSADSMAWLSVGTGLSISGTTLSASGLLVASNNLSDLGSVSTARTNLGLTTAATTALGTSGATIPLLNGSNTFSGSTVFTTDVQLSYASPNLDLVGTGSNIVRLQFRNGSRYDDIRNTTAGMEFRVNTSGTPLSMLFTTGGGLQVQIAISAETTGTLTSASRNMMVHCTGNITLPASGMTDGDMILIDPRGTARTISRPAAHTMYVNDVDSATATSTARSLVVAKYNGSSSWSLSGI